MNERIKQLRNNLRLTQEDFGKLIKVAKTTVSTMEIGKQPITERNILTICEKFDVNETWLRTGEGEMFNTGKTHADLLPNTHNLSPRAVLIMQNFLELSKSEQDKFVELAEKIFKEEKNNKQNKTALEVASIEIGKIAADSGVTEKVSFHIDEEN
jgi:transcriptional regulator with XRE-family HTH domain